MATGLVWDSTDVVWDDPVATWDGGGVLGAQPAFQATAFQTDAFQASPVISVTIAQNIPAFRQTAAGLSGYFASITQTAPAFTQAGDVTVGVAVVASQTLGAFSQSGTVDMTVRGFIGSRVTTFQEGAFQEDAFQTAADEAHVMPAFTQVLVGAVVEHGTAGGPIAQFIPAFTQAADAALEFGIVIAQSMPAFTQAGTVEQPTAGATTQTAPAFLQAALGAIITNAAADIEQTMPMFTQSLHASIVRWDEWPVGFGDEWPVSTDDEWLVRQ
jgi:hypothetical protein